MTAACVCGAVRVTIEAPPAFIHDCNCGLCRKVGAAWGYFPFSSVATAGDTLAFERRDKENAGSEIHFCGTCGTTTHFAPTRAFRERNPGADEMGVNMRLFDPVTLEGVELRFPNGRDWPGQGPFGYRRPSMTIHARSPW